MSVTSVTADMDFLRSAVVDIAQRIGLDLPPAPGSGGEQGKCNCDFADQSWHDKLLQMESDGTIIGCLAPEVVECASHGSEYGGDLADWEQLAFFVRQHAWKDQVGMDRVAELLIRIANWDR